MCFQHESQGTTLKLPALDSASLNKTLLTIPYNYIFNLNQWYKNIDITPKDKHNYLQMFKIEYIDDTYVHLVQSLQ